MSSLEKASALAAGTAVGVLLILLPHARAVHAEEAAPAPPPAMPAVPAMPAMPAMPTAVPGDCLKYDRAGVPPPAGVDCTEYQSRLEQQAKRMKLLAEIKEITGQMDKAEAPPPAAAQAPAAPPPEANDRVLEVFGEQAGIVYLGNSLLVRQGQALPQGGRVERVSLEGVVVSDEGGRRRTLPFFIGALK